MTYATGTKSTSLTRCTVAHKHYVIQNGAEIVHDPNEKICEAFALVTQDTQKVTGTLTN